MNFVVSPIIKLLGVATIVLATLGYINILRSDNKALEASVERYKLMSEHNASVANDNAKLLLQQQNDYQQLFSNYKELMNNIDIQNKNQLTKEKEVVRYVERLPEGFEKQCLNMFVPADIGRVQNN